MSIASLFLHSVFILRRNHFRCVSATHFQNTICWHQLCICKCRNAFNVPFQMLKYIVTICMAGARTVNPKKKCFVWNLHALNGASASNFQPISYVAVHELAHGQYKIGMSKMRLKVCVVWFRERCICYYWLEQSKNYVLENVLEKYSRNWGAH